MILNQIDKNISKTLGNYIPAENIKKSVPRKIEINFNKSKIMENYNSMLNNKFSKKDYIVKKEES